ncbi:MAG TPA: hypothetical protein VHC42_08135 [Rhizomicrobium sp.]|jgi:hypothetical protein|nr:hypothetical protein [Rhizomicrobium sp.]
MRLGDNRFFNLFALVASATGGDRARDAWTVEGVDWTRERLSRRSAACAFQIEVFELARAGRGGWRLLVGHETWWDADHPDAFRNGRWAHVARGARSDVIEWFLARERELA